MNKMLGIVWRAVCVILNMLRDWRGYGLAHWGSLDSLDSSRNLQANYAISFLFRLDLVVHACASFEIWNFELCI